MLVSSPRPNRIVTSVPDKVGNLCYKVLQYPDALRRANDHKLNKYIMLVSSPRPNRIVTSVPDKVGNLCYKVLQYPDTLRRAKTPKCGRYVNTRHTNKITTLCIIYHQKGLNEEILDHQTILRKTYSILRYKQNTTKVSICT
jgi:hypothetical protein